MSLRIVEYPIVLDDNGDLLIFDGPSELLVGVEAIDVRDGAYSAWDAVGRALTLVVAAEGVAAVVTDIDDADGLKRALVDFGERVGDAGLNLDQDDVLRVMVDCLAAFLRR